MNTTAIVHEVLRGYSLSVRGYHGVGHWARVLENGRRLARTTGARVDVVTLFALFHDSRRINDDVDPGHGARGAELAASLRGEFFEIDDRGFALFHLACRDHTAGLTEADETIQTCWDADRLDLGRVGIEPDPRRLCTDAARRLLGWAHGRAVGSHEPPLVAREWGL